MEENKKCPKCGSEEKQWKMGFTASKTRRCKCGACGKTYTLNPKKHEYPPEIVTQAIKMYFSGVSGRQVGKFFGFNKYNVYNWIKKNEQPVDNLSEIRVR